MNWHDCHQNGTTTPAIGTAVTTPRNPRGRGATPITTTVITVKIR
jgi:hypothetical protein